MLQASLPRVLHRGRHVGTAVIAEGYTTLYLDESVGPFTAGYWEPSWTGPNRHWRWVAQFLEMEVVE